MKHISNLLFISLFIIACSNPQKETTNQDAVNLTMITSPAGENSEEPFLATGANGDLYLSWVERRDDSTTLKFSKWHNNSWSSPEKIASGNDWFVNWADYPSIEVNQNGDMVAHYLQMSDTGTYTYDIKVVSKTKESATWSAPVKLHSDTVNAEHGFVSIQPYNDGNFFVSWLDGRNTAGGGHGNHGHGAGAMTVRAATLTPDLVKVVEYELDSRVCDCCQTSATIMNNNPFVVYRDRSEDEIRDIYFVQFYDSSWTTPQSVSDDNWNIAGCPVNGPKIASNNGKTAVAWFTAAKDKPTVKMAFYNQQNARFETPIVIDNTHPLGRVDIDLLEDGSALVSWLDNDEATTTIKLAHVMKNGTIQEIRTLATTSESRASGFPQIAVHNNKVFLAWTSLSAEFSKVKTACFEL